MTRFRLVAVLAVLGLAIPFAGSAEDAPGTFKIPGTDSTIKFYGYTQLDMTLDFGARVGDIENNDWATNLFAVPNDNTADKLQKKPQLYMTARTSRFGIQTNTPTAIGNVGVRLEADFNGTNQFQTETFTSSSLFRLRHAYGTVGGLLVGQTWSTFLDLAAYPDVVDFNGPGTIALVRNPMIRYTLALSPGVSLAIAAENKRGAQFGGAVFETLPDFHANLGYSGSWGSVSVRGVTQYYRVFNGDVPPLSKFSVAGAASGSFKLGGDTVVAQFSGGPGIGRYLLNAFGATFNLSAAEGNIGGNPGGFIIANNELNLVTVLGAHAGYTHVWSPSFRSNLIAAGTWIIDPKITGRPADNTIEKDLYQAFVNTFWTFAKNAEFGIEFVGGVWRSFENGTPLLTGHQYRVNSSFHYNFF